MQRSISSTPRSPRRRPPHHLNNEANNNEDNYGQARSEVPHQEEETLLGSHAVDGGDLKDQRSKRLVSPLYHDRVVRLTSLTLLCALVACLVIFATSGFRRGSSTSGFRRASDEYVLSQTWDYNASPTVRDYEWEIIDIVANPDGIYRPMITINGKFPGPLVEGNEGDMVRFRVTNRSANSTSIHFHGLLQNGTNWMDGTPGVTQCPIPAGHSFTYEFLLAQSGTYMYHAHHAAQSLDGLFGPFIIHSHEEVAQSQASDRVILVQDWYHDLSAGLMFQNLSPGSDSSPIPGGALINGWNKVDCREFEDYSCDTSNFLMPTIDLAPGSLPHRLRIINTGGFAWFDVAIDGHANALSLIEMDGVAIHPTQEQKVVIGPGQRYSILVNPPPEAQDGEVFWLRARMITECFAGTTPGSGDVVTLLRYLRPRNYASKPPKLLGAAVSALLGGGRGGRNDQEVDRVKKLHGHNPTKITPLERATECKDMKSATYKPVLEKNAPEIAHHSWKIRVNMKIGDWRLERGYMNQSSFRPRVSAPTLHRMVAGLHDGNDSFSLAGVNDRAFDISHELVISQKSVEVVDLVIQNLDEGNHPFHLHGYQMFILGQGHGYFPGYEYLGLAPEGKGLLLSGSHDSILNNPPRRDTATVEGFGWLLVRFVADNPGVWYFHCHIAWHEGAGMGMQFASRLDLMTDWSIPKANLDLCSVGASELSKGSPPEDIIWASRGNEP